MSDGLPLVCSRREFAPLLNVRARERHESSGRGVHTRVVRNALQLSARRLGGLVARVLVVGVLSFGSAAPVAASPNESAVTHTVQAGDTLFDLSEQYLDDPLLWPELGQANGLTDPYRVPIGTRLEVPLHLLRRKAGGATVVHVSGNVTRSRPGQPPETVVLSERIVDGDTLETAADGFVTLALADGSHIRVAGNSVVHMQQLRYIVRRKQGDTVINMDKGRVESTVPPRRAANRSRFRIQSPLMAAGVRGTHFGVTVTESGTVTSDVHEGSVDVTARGGQSRAQVRAGFGTVATSSSRVAPPSRLLSAPDLSHVANLHQRPLIDFSFPAVAAAQAYRVYVAHDADFYQVVSSQLVEQPRVRIPHLDDDHYFVSVRAVDEKGIEGRSAVRAIELDARPLPPVTVAPEQEGVMQTDNVTFRWATQDDVAFYELELAKDPKFGQQVVDVVKGQASEVTINDLASGVYYWRVRAAQRTADGVIDQGPFGDARRFDVRRDVAVKPEHDGENLRLRWEGEAGQRFRLQVADDAGFARLVHETETVEREAALGELPGGSYYLRVQITDADGYVRPFTEPQVFQVRSFMRTGTGELLRLGDDSPVHRGS